MNETLLDVQNLVKVFPVAGRGREGLRAVDDISFTVRRGEALGLVGESGSGKSTTVRCVLRLIEPSSGAVSFDGIDVTRCGYRELRQVRRRAQLVFQDPYSALNPRMRVEDIVAEGLKIHGIGGDRAERREKVLELLEIVGLRRDHLDRRPAAFSGGERQRIGIARALAVSPEILVCDEPVASLDVSIQAQILNLFKDLKDELDMTILFIAHDLATVRHLCDRVAVLERGQLREIGPIDEVYENPSHPYTKELIGAVPIPDPARERARLAARRQRRRPAGAESEVTST